MTSLAIAQAQPLDFGRFAFLTAKRKAVRDMIGERKLHDAETALTKLACISLPDERDVARVRNHIVAGLEHEMMLKRQQMIAERMAREDKGSA